MPNEHHNEAFGVMAAYKINRGKWLSLSPHTAGTNLQLDHLPEPTIIKERLN